jgi:MFS family permease
LGVELKKGFERRNFFAIPLTTTTVAYIGTFINVAIFFLLKDPEFYNIPKSEIGRVTSDITFYGLIFGLLITLVIGYVFDIAGRRLTLFFTLVISSVLVALMPYVAPSIILLIILRLGIVLPMSACGSQPLVNDYVKKDFRGRAIAMASFGIIIGELLTFLVILNITKGLSPYF